MKLIKSGKVLKDEDVLSAIGVKENDFLVVMIAKPKKSAAPKETAPKASTPAQNAPAAQPAADSASAASSPAPTTATSTTTPAPASTSVTTPAAPAGQSSEFPPEVVSNLTSMGFPDEEVRHCLRAAQGNPDMAVEFLTNGIPEGVNVPTGTSSAPTPAAPSSSSSSSQTLQALRNHPQFNDLRRLVQSNPQMLQSVLSQIGQQQPQLLQEINDNQALFLQMMNEPVDESTTGSSAPVPSEPSSNSGAGTGPGALGGLGGLGNPAQMAQMINSMSAEELQQMATMMGLSPDQLRATAQMIGQMPPEQLQQFMMQAMGGGGGAGAPPGPGMGAPQVLRLTDEEMAAVDRLTEMGFDRAEAAQAFLACDKNEALAANLLMDSMGDEGGFFGGGGSGGNNSSNNDGNNNDNNNEGDNDEDMYD